LTGATSTTFAASFEAKSQIIDQFDD